MPISTVSSGDDGALQLVNVPKLNRGIIDSDVDTWLNKELSAMLAASHEPELGGLPISGQAVGRPYSTSARLLSSRPVGGPVCDKTLRTSGPEHPSLHQVARTSRTARARALLISATSQKYRNLRPRDSTDSVACSHIRYGRNVLNDIASWPAGWNHRGLGWPLP